MCVCVCVPIFVYCHICWVAVSPTAEAVQVSYRVPLCAQENCRVSVSVVSSCPQSRVSGPGSVSARLAPNHRHKLGPAVVNCKCGFSVKVSNQHLLFGFAVENTLIENLHPLAQMSFFVCRTSIKSGSVPCSPEVLLQRGRTPEISGLPTR